VTSPAVDQGIENINDILGFFLLTAGLAAAVFGLSNRLQRWLLGGAFAILLSINLLVWKEHFWQVGQLLELSVLTASPLVYLYYGAAGAQQRASAYRLIRWLIALTFIGHGLYAVGFHAVPANFVLMVQAGLGVGEGVARDLLLMVGFLDFIAAALLLLPFREARRAALLWIIPWALLTTTARLWSYGGLVSSTTLLTQWVPEVVIRLPHVFLPVAIWVGLRRP